MDRRFDGKVIVVTGAGTGLGRAAAVRLAKEGARLSLIDVNAQALQDAREAILAEAPNTEILPTTADVSIEGEVKSYVEQTIRHLDRRRPPFPRITAPRMLVGRRAGLIAPGDLRILLGCPRFDGRVGLPQPGADLRGVLVAGVAARPLGRVAPALQVLAYGPHRQQDAALDGELAGPPDQRRRPDVLKGERDVQQRRRQQQRDAAGYVACRHSHRVSIRNE